VPDNCSTWHNDGRVGLLKNRKVGTAHLTAEEWSRGVCAEGDRSAVRHSLTYDRLNALSGHADVGIMEKIARLTESQRDNLVAYLDGELEDDDAREIDEALARSPVARHEVQMLTKTIELIDLLERPAASAEFTKKTLASLARVEAKPLAPPAELGKYVRRGGVLALWMAALALSTWAGYSLTNRWFPTEHDLLLDDLPVIERYQDYKRVGDAAFLLELQKRGLLKDAPYVP
jgi:hypothetical protein